MGVLRRPAVARYKHLTPGMVATLCLAVVAVALMVLSIVKFTRHSDVERMLHRGFELFIALHGHPQEALSAEWYSRRQMLQAPASRGAGSFTSSTEYFRALVTNGYLTVDYGFFAAPGVLPYEGKDPAGFTSQHNAWCVVAGIDRQHPERRLPLFFSKNLRITNLAQSAECSLSGEPFGDECVVVYSDGTGAVLQPAQLVLEFSPEGATNTVLRP